MPTAQIIAIGTELLLGVTQDTNTSFIARTLNQYGVDIFKTSIIGDNEARIAREIKDTLKDADIIITTGGLGPTIDDPTRQAVARAFDVEVEFHPELWEQIKQRFYGFGREPSENNKRQAHLPQGAQAIKNPVGTAPAFAYLKQGKIVISLPGVPSEMKTLLMNDVIPLLQREYDLGGTTLSRTLHTCGMGESNVDELISDFETYSNPTVGLAAHPGIVDIRITAKAASKDKARELIQPVEAQIREILGVSIFGADGETLPEVLTKLAQSHAIKLGLFCTGELEKLAAELMELPIFNACQSIPPQDQNKTPAPESLYNDTKQHDCLVLFTHMENERTAIHMQLYLNGSQYDHIRKFGGHPALYPLWVKNHIFSFIRESIIKEKGDLCKK